MTARSGPRFSPALFLLTCIALALLLCLPATGTTETVQHIPPEETAGRDSPFAGSQLIASPDKVHEGETIAYTLTVRTGESETPEQIEVIFRLPGPVMLASSSPPMVYNEEYQRELVWEGENSPGRDLVFTITLVTMPDSASLALLAKERSIMSNGK